MRYLRADRQLEFTQVDLEMSFPRQETVFDVTEKFLAAGFKAAGVTLLTPFPRISYDDAMRRFGSDKPDLRLPGLTDVRAAFTDENLTALQIDPLLPVVTLRIPNVGELSRKEREDNHPFFDLKKGAKFIDDFKRLAKGFPESAVKVRELAGATDADFVIIVAGDPAHHIKASDTKFEGRLSEREINVYSAAGNFRTELAKKYAERHGAFGVTEKAVREAEPGQPVDGAQAFQPIWITDFPMFEYDAALARWMPAHHPFTSPHEADMANLLTDPASVRANCYDLAMNGMELGSGSIRIHRKDVQQQIFQSLGISDEEARARFGFFLERIGVWHTAAWRHRAGTGPDRDAAGRRAQPARGDRLPQDRQGYRPDGGRADDGYRAAVEGTAYPGSAEELDLFFFGDQKTNWTWSGNRVH